VTKLSGATAAPPLNEDGGLSFADADRTVHDPRALVRWSTILEMLPAEQQRIRAAVASMSANEFRLWLAAIGDLCLPKAIERFRQKCNSLVRPDGQRSEAEIEGANISLVRPDGQRSEAEIEGANNTKEQRTASKEEIRG
jgi:hypothetical protein